ncbi:hypothetical protein BGZ50_000811, partial [Haplosporangium sp. Z 11]
MDEDDHQEITNQQHLNLFLYGPSQRPLNFVSLPLQQQTLSFPSLPSLPNGFQWIPTPSWPSQLSSFPVTPVQQPTQNPQYSSPGVISVTQSPQLTPIAIRQPTPQAETSTHLGKRNALITSIRQDKQRKVATQADALLEAQGEVQILQLNNRQQAERIQLLEAEKSTLQSQLATALDRLSRIEDDITSFCVAVKELQAVKAAPVPAATHDVPAPAAVASISASSAPSSSPPSEPRSYAHATRAGLTPEQLEVIKLMKPAPRPFRPSAAANAPVAPNTPTVRIYFGNMQSCPLGVLKARLRALRIRTSCIYNYSFLGKSICELLVDPSYKDDLIAKMEQFTFRHLPNYDPAVPQDPNVSAEVRARLKEAFAHRLRKTASTTTRPVVRQVFINMMTEASIPVPEDLPDNTASAEVVPTAENADEEMTMCNRLSQRWF